MVILIMRARDSSESSSDQSEPPLPDSESEDSYVDEKTLAGIVIYLENLEKKL